MDNTNAFAARYTGTCTVCSTPIALGQLIEKSGDRCYRHSDCVAAVAAEQALIVVTPSSNGGEHYECQECGRKGYSLMASGPEIAHSRSCVARPQFRAPVAVEAAPVVAVAAPVAVANLGTVARDYYRDSVRRCSDNDLVDAVRLGLISESAAMNSDG